MKSRLSSTLAAQGRLPRTSTGAYAAHMASRQRLSTNLDFRGLSKQQEAFARLVADGMPVTEAASQIYSDSASPSAYGRELLNNRKVAARIEQLQHQRETIAALNRDSLTVRALEIEGLATEDKKFIAGVSALRLAADLQGLTTSNPVREQTMAFLSFLAGDKPAVGDVQFHDRALAADEIKAIFEAGSAGMIGP